MAIKSGNPPAGVAPVRVPVIEVRRDLIVVKQGAVEYTIMAKELGGHLTPGMFMPGDTVLVALSGDNLYLVDERPVAVEPVDPFPEPLHVEASGASKFPNTNFTGAAPPDHPPPPPAVPTTSKVVTAASLKPTT